MKSTTIQAVAVTLVVAATATSAQAGSGYLISAPLSSASGRVECAVVNAHPTKNAILTAYVYDASCNRLSYAMNIAPGEHDAADLPLSPGSATCVIDLTSPDNSVARSKLVASFSALDAGGHPTAALPVSHYQSSFTQCLP